MDQTLNSCSGALFTPVSEGQKRPCSSLSETASGSKGQEKETGVRGTSENPHTILHQVLQSSLPRSPSPPPRLCDSSILAQKRRPQHLLNPGAPSSAGQARGGGDRQEASAGGTPRSRVRGCGPALPAPSEPRAESAPPHLLQPRARAPPAWRGQAGPGPTAGVGLRRPASPVGDASVPLLLAGSAPPIPDWLSGLETARHWPARLSLGAGPASSGSRVVVLGDHPSFPVASAGAPRSPWVATPFLGQTLPGSVRGPPLPGQIRALITQTNSGGLGRALDWESSGLR